MLCAFGVQVATDNKSANETDAVMIKALGFRSKGKCSLVQI